MSGKIKMNENSAAELFHSMHCGLPGNWSGLKTRSVDIGHGRCQGPLLKVHNLGEEKTQPRLHKASAISVANS